MYRAGFYRNIKHNTIYFSPHTIISATNKDSGKIKVLYYAYENNTIRYDKGFERCIDEFLIKFERCDV